MRTGPAIAVLLFSAAATVRAAEVVVRDRPDDAGEAAVVSWTGEEGVTPSRHVAFVRPADVPIFLYVLRELRTPGEGPLRIVDLPPDVREFTAEELDPEATYLATVAAVGEGGSLLWIATSPPFSPEVNWFNTRRIWLAVLLAVVCGAVLAYIAAARRGLNLWVRPIAGLEAVTDAVGRAVEMGRSVLFVPGIQDINDIQTVAGITILSRVARVVADYDAEIKVPTARSLVMATARETVESSFLHAGRPESYHSDDIYYLTDEQFGYVAGVTGQMVRERPAACFYMGSFYAESLILAETGNAIGSIQLAGTAQPSQLPFFIAACDYTLIGEEFFAASAYLSGEPQQLGSLKGQDFGKVLCGVLILVGCTLATAAMLLAAREASEPDGPIATAFEYLHDNVLGDEGFFPREAE